MHRTQQLTPMGFDIDQVLTGVKRGPDPDIQRELVEGLVRKRPRLDESEDLQRLVSKKHNEYLCALKSFVEHVAHKTMFGTKPVKDEEKTTG